MRVAIIPARGASRRVPRKNVRLFHGLPMLSYPIRTAQASGLFDLIVVSTDDAQIAGVAFECGATVIPRPFDDGTTGTQEIAARVLDQLDAHGMACVIYATSPLVSAEDLKCGYYAMQEQPFAVSVDEDGNDAGCFYWGTTMAFRSRHPLDLEDCAHLILPAERVCDINVPADWRRAEQMFTALEGK